MRGPVAKFWIVVGVVPPAVVSFLSAFCFLQCLCGVIIVHRVVAGLGVREQALDVIPISRLYLLVIFRVGSVDFRIVSTVSFYDASSYANDVPEVEMLRRSASEGLHATLLFPGTSNEIFNHLMIEVLSLDVAIVVQKKLPSRKFQVDRTLLAIPPKSGMLPRKTFREFCGRPLPSDASCA